jgi:S-adenosylmethionine:tRNA ribosyltransferase-isomerase
MKLDDFDFPLPPELVAQRPVTPRDTARLLQVAGGAIRDRMVRDLPALLRPGDVMVFNDTKVIPARLFGRRGLGKVEVTLHQCLGPERWRAFARPAKRLKPGDRIDFAENFSAEIAEKLDGGELTLSFSESGPDLMSALQRHGAMPLPPYIRREGGDDSRDRSDYQTVYARSEGAVAAPTAGLHFTDELLAALDARGVTRATLTLHVGAGTFLPVKTQRVEDHPMHGESGVVSAEAAASINEAKAKGGRVVAVGTTSLRLLETASANDGSLAPFAGETKLFILPGHRFKIVDLLMTNFHLPKSTLFMLVCAFAGTDLMKRAYAHAIAEGYRFYSYGDSSLLERA